MLIELNKILAPKTPHLSYKRRPITADRNTPVYGDWTYLTDKQTPLHIRDILESREWIIVPPEGSNSENPTRIYFYTKNS